MKYAFQKSESRLKCEIDLKPGSKLKFLLTQPTSTHDDNDMDTHGEPSSSSPKKTSALNHTPMRLPLTEEYANYFLKMFSTGDLDKDVLLLGTSVLKACDQHNIFINEV